MPDVFLKRASEFVGCRITIRFVTRLNQKLLGPLFG
jgi:hypothetical protein